MRDAISGVVEPAHRPTLPELLRPWWAARSRRTRIALGLLVAVPVLALLGLWLRPADRGAVFSSATPYPFTFRYPEPMRRVAPVAGELVRVERRRPDGLFLDRFSVAPLALPAYRGELSGMLPALAVAEVAALRRRFTGFEWVQEGKTRVRQAPAYAISFRAREGARRLSGRVVLVPEPVPGTRRAVRLLFLSTPAAGTSDPRRIEGAARVPYRSFRFGEA